MEKKESTGCVVVQTEDGETKKAKKRKSATIATTDYTFIIRDGDALVIHADRNMSDENLITLRKNFKEVTGLYPKIMLIPGFKILGIIKGDSDEK